MVSLYSLIAALPASLCAFAAAARSSEYAFMQFLYSSISRWNFLRAAVSLAIARIGACGLDSHLCFGTSGAAACCACAVTAALASNTAAIRVDLFMLGPIGERYFLGAGIVGRGASRSSFLASPLVTSITSAQNVPCVIGQFDFARSIRVAVVLRRRALHVLEEELLVGGVACASVARVSASFHSTTGAGSRR